MTTLLCLPAKKALDSHSIRARPLAQTLTKAQIEVWLLPLALTKRERMKVWKRISGSILCLIDEEKWNSWHERLHERIKVLRRHLRWDIQFKSVLLCYIYVPFMAFIVGKCPGIYDDWDKVQQQIKGFPNSEYCSKVRKKQFIIIRRNQIGILHAVLPVFKTRCSRLFPREKARLAQTQNTGFHPSRFKQVSVSLAFSFNIKLTSLPGWNPWTARNPPPDQ